MKSRVLLILVGLVFGVAGQAFPQETKAELPTYTVEQRWARSSNFMIGGFAILVTYAKSRGQTVNELGQYLGKLYAPSWSRESAGQPMRVLRGFYRNWMSWPDTKLEIIESSQSSVTARMNRPYLEYFGEDGKSYDCTVEEYERAFELTHKGIADYLDLRYEQRRQGDSLIVTMSNKGTTNH